MPRKHKTREQKKKADERNAAQASSSSVISTPTYSFSATSTQQIKNFSALPAVHTEQLVRHDLLKTLITSVGIVALQLMFFYLLKNHVLAISFVRY